MNEMECANKLKTTYSKPLLHLSLTLVLILEVFAPRGSVLFSRSFGIGAAPIFREGPAKSSKHVHPQGWQHSPLAYGAQPINKVGNTAN